MEQADNYVHTQISHKDDTTLYTWVWCSNYKSFVISVFAAFNIRVV